MAAPEMLRTITISLTQTNEDDEAFTEALNAGLIAFQEATKEVAWTNKVEAVRVGNPQVVEAGFTLYPMTFNSTL